MRVGIPKEIKNNENRVGMTPAGVAELTRRGHEVFVQHTAGEGSGFSDDEYLKIGAKILPTIEDVYKQADMIVKVKEPIEPEYALVRKGQLLHARRSLQMLCLRVEPCVWLTKRYSCLTDRCRCYNL